MKKGFFFFLLLFAAAIVGAQMPKVRLTENAVVKDSAGTVYPALVWQALLRKGTFALKAENSTDPNTAFLLVRLSDAQVQQRMEKLPKPRESGSFRTGQKVVLAKVTDMQGNKLNLKDLTGKITVLNFWFINCPPCRMEIPDLNELVESYKGKENIQFVGVALDDRHSLKEFLQALPFHYAIVDNGRFLTDMYRIRSYPTHVIIGPDAKVYFHTTGLGQNTVYWLKKSIDELLAQVTVVKSEP